MAKMACVAGFGLSDGRALSSLLPFLRRIREGGVIGWEAQGFDMLPLLELAYIDGCFLACR